MKGILATGLVAVGTVGLTAFATGCSNDDSSALVPNSETAAAVDSESGVMDGLTFEVRRDPGCGCCTSWVDYVRTHGASVEVSEDPDRATFRSANGIGDDAASCHTAVLDGYAIEGHVPVEAIERLLQDRPDVAGLAVPGMPMKSPGMGGDESDWAVLPVMMVGNDGSLTPFDY